MGFKGLCWPKQGSNVGGVGQFTWALGAESGTRPKHVSQTCKGLKHCVHLENARVRAKGTEAPAFAFVLGLSSPCLATDTFLISSHRTPPLPLLLPDHASGSYEVQFLRCNALGF